MRILLSAFACEPYGGSEPGNGWTWAEALARRHQVTVLTDSAHRERIEAELARRPNPNLEFHYLGSGPQGYIGLDIYPYYYKWQRDALDLARRLHAERPFDVAHHVTYGIHRVPSYMWKLGIPFVWGPVGGGEDVPFAFYLPRWLGWRESAREVIRWTWNRLCILDPRLRATARHAAVIGVTTRQTLEAYPADTHSRAVVVPSSILNAADLDVIAAHPAQPGPKDGLSLAFVGRQLGWKGPSFALHAFARYAARYPAASLHFYGTGPMADFLRDLAGRLGVQEKVVFHGSVSRAEMLRAYGRHNAFLFPSLHDSSGFASIEAQAAGLPVVCLDAGGPGMQVPPQAGVKVPPRSPEQAIADLADGLARLTDDGAFWAACSSAAREHALDPKATPNIEEMIDRLYGRLYLPPLRGKPTEPIEALPAD
ncbi:MAG TPA: glycosyltransferase family 4 protein [Deinococcales bacterium]|nr:glycosyltransferase family 4 protein [Deinococcales bacterium]